MKNAIRKLLSLVMALAPIMSLSITAFAADIEKGTLQVSGDQLGNKSVTAALMFTANVKDSIPEGSENGDGLIGSGDSVGYDLVATWQGFFDTKVANKAGEHATSVEAYNYVKELTDDDLEAFAEAAMQYIKTVNGAVDNNNDITVRTVNAVEGTDTVTFTDLTADYYVVYPEAGSTSVDRGTESMLVNVPSAMSQSLTIKSEYPTVEKKVGQDKEEISAEIGDTVTFTLTSRVPEMSDYKTYAFYFVDTMFAGLTYVDNSAKVAIDNTEVTPNRVTYTNNVLRVEFDDLKTLPVGNGTAATMAGKNIVVTYSAVVNVNAVIGANTNTAKVEYSNDPDWIDDPNDDTDKPPVEPSDEDDAKVYVTKIIIDKYTGETYDQNATHLEGAVFSLKKTGETEPIKLVKKEGNDNTYRVATPDEITADEVEEETEKTLITQVITDANGKIEIEGLAAGTYFLEEIAAPTGCNKLAEDVKIEIIFVEATDEAEAKFTYKVGYDAETQPRKSTTIPVENKTGAVLPETGAMGTIGLTLFGVAVVILGIALPRKKNGRA